MDRIAKVGEHVIWHDPSGIQHDGLVTAVHTPTCLNLVVVDHDSSKTDIYGRQIFRPTSSSHKSANQVHGFYWRFPDEEPNQYVKPLET